MFHQITTPKSIFHLLYILFLGVVRNKLLRVTNWKIFTYTIFSILMLFNSCSDQFAGNFDELRINRIELVCGWRVGNQGNRKKIGGV